MAAPTKEGLLAVIDAEIELIEARVSWPSWPILTAAVVAIWTHLSLASNEPIATQRYWDFFLAGYLATSVMLNFILVLTPPRNESILGVVYPTKPVLGRLSYVASLVGCLVPLFAVGRTDAKIFWTLRLPVYAFYSLLGATLLRRFYMSWSGRDKFRPVMWTWKNKSSYLFCACLLLWSTIVALTHAVDLEPRLGELKVMLPVFLPIPLLSILLMTHDRPMPLLELRQIRAALIFNSLSLEDAFRKYLETTQGTSPVPAKPL